MKRVLSLLLIAAMFLGGLSAVAETERERDAGAYRHPAFCRQTTNRPPAVLHGLPAF